jgi:hypothetical protein
MLTKHFRSELFDDSGTVIGKLGKLFNKQNCSRDFLFIL